MPTIAPKALALIFLLAFPLAGAAPGRQATPRSTEIVEDDDAVVALDDADSPAVVRVQGHRAHGAIGVRLIEMTPDLRAHFGTPRDAGVLVGEVESDGAAAKAGVAVGDIITAVDGERVESPGQIARAVRYKKPGESVKLDVSRDRAGKQLTVKVQESTRPRIEIGDLGELGHLGEMGPEVNRMVRDIEIRRPLLERDRDRLQQRLDRLEKRLADLERKLAR